MHPVVLESIVLDRFDPVPPRLGPSNVSYGHENAATLVSTLSRSNLHARRIDKWSLASLQQRLVKSGGPAD